MKIVAIVGARPNFVKIAPIVAELRTRPEAITTLIHTGQHYDGPMPNSFFANLELPDPDVNLHVMASGATAQIAEIMLRLEPVLAGALTASKLGLRLAHVEAGLRSFDRTMPEEINRVLTDSISDLLFTTEPAANENLARPRSSRRSQSSPGSIACSPCTGPAMSTRRTRFAPSSGLSRGSRANARCVLTDSGGIQEETTALGVPCLTLRENTERPITVSRGTNRVIGVEPHTIYAHWQRAADGEWPKGELPDL